MYFDQASVDGLHDVRAAIMTKRLETVEALLTRQYKVDRAKEFAAHGISRRLRSMEHCIGKVFEILPPEREDEPSMDELVDAVVYIQAFTFNAFACVDNLAWIWVCEQQLTTDRGETIPLTKVGLSKKCRIVRRSLPSDLQQHLKSLDKWFDQLENFRHALAHRIPLYIPPCVIPQRDVREYRVLEQKMDEARRKGKLGRYERLKAMQKALTRYQPEMMHSAEEKSKRVIFHPQLLADFDVICELAKRMNTALDSSPKATVERRFWGWIFQAKEWLARMFGPLRPVGP